MYIMYRPVSYIPYTFPLFPFLLCCYATYAVGLTTPSSSHPFARNRRDRRQAEVFAATGQFLYQLACGVTLGSRLSTHPSHVTKVRNPVC
ncbi:hypothetical protein F5Y02DRAFT_393027 [Annulohypoxylon stygium]|nr:hypothetical protein F5Y02DRAFT_393027 [Annulohypoxylon stygium]